MSAYLVLVFAVLSRILPHTFHATGMNFTAVGGSLLFFGARRSRWQALIAMAVLAATDFYLTVYVYGYAFHASEYLVTWAWYGAVCLMGAGLLRQGAGLRSAGAVRAGLAVLASSTSFFLISNFMVWMSSGMYARSASGLAVCYGAAVPFYANDLVSTAMTVAVLFGLPVVAADIARSLGEASAAQQPLG